MTDIYYVLFPIWTGGNHLINVLSTSSRLTKTTDTNIDDLKAFYYQNKRNYFHYHKDNKTEYHLSNELQLVKLHKLLSKNDTPVLFGSHLPFLMEHFETLKNFGSITIILLDIPSSTSLAGTRAEKQMHITESHSGTEALFYKPKIISRLFELPITSIIDVSTELFNQPNTPVFYNLEQILNLGLDITLCNELHTVWMNKIYGL